MRFKNTTNVPDSLLREVIRFACPSSVTNYSIWFKKYRDASKRIPFCGRAYIERRHIACRIPRYQRLARPYDGAGGTKGKGYLPWGALTYEEAVVALVAHELNHLAQAKNPRLYRRTWSARGRFSERDCDVYAIRKMREWRATHGVTTSAPYPFIPITLKRKPLTPRQRLEALAAPCGIQLSIDYVSGGLTYWVNAPESLCDSDGEMENDPYMDCHYHDDWHDAKKAIETYARLAAARGITPEGPKVDPSDGAISLDSAAQPATVIA